MKIIILLFILLIKNLNGGIYPLERYDSSQKIYSSDPYGFVVLDLSKFDSGDSIYITYRSHEGKLRDYVNYTFSDSYPRSYNNSLLTQYIYCYSNSTSITKENRSTDDSYEIYYTYNYYYYYEFKKPNDARYLVLEYDLTYSHPQYLLVNNDRYSPMQFVIILACISIGCGVFFTTILIIFAYYENKKGGYGTNYSNVNHLYDITNSNNYYEEKSKKPLDTISTSSEIHKNINAQYSEPEQKPLIELMSNYNQNEVPDQPHFM